MDADPNSENLGLVSAIVRAMSLNGLTANRQVEVSDENDMDGKEPV